MTKEDNGFPLPEVRFLVARNWRARFGLAAIAMVALYMLSAVVSLSQDNKRLNERNNQLSIDQANATVRATNQTNELLNIITKLDNQITLLGGNTPEPIKEQLKSVLEEGMVGAGGSNEATTPNSSKSVRGNTTTTTMVQGQTSTTAAQAETTTTFRPTATTTTVGKPVPTTTTTRPRICVANETICFQLNKLLSGLPKILGDYEIRF